MSTTATIPADTSVPDMQQWVAQVAALSAQCDAVQRENVQLRAQVAWFQRQLLGKKSEKRIVETDAVQGTLGEVFDAVPDTPGPARRRAWPATRELPHPSVPPRTNRKR